MSETAPEKVIDGKTYVGIGGRWLERSPRGSMRCPTCGEFRRRIVSADRRTTCFTCLKRQRLFLLPGV